MTVTSKLYLYGHVGVIAVAVQPFAAQVAYDFQVWLVVYDRTVGAYNTKTLIYEKSDTSYPYDGGKYWDPNYDQDFSATFSADAGHNYDIEVGVCMGVIGACIGASMFTGNLDFSQQNGGNYYILTRYISLSW